MLRIKRRRTKPRCHEDGNRIYNTMNSTSPHKVYKNENTYQDLIHEHPGCTKKNCYCVTASEIDGEPTTSRLREEFVCCKTTPYRNPILGYRKQLDCCLPSFAHMTIGYKEEEWGFEREGSSYGIFTGTINGAIVRYLYTKTGSFALGLSSTKESGQIASHFIKSLSLTASDGHTVTVNLSEFSPRSFMCLNQTATMKMVHFMQMHVDERVKVTWTPAPTKAPTNTVYKDNYAKSCGRARDTTKTQSACYQPVIQKKQNRNGFINDQYNYSMKQYLNRRCRTHKQQAFNFRSNTALTTTTIDGKVKGKHNFATQCHASPYNNNNPQCAIDCSNGIVGCKEGQSLRQVKCSGYSLCAAQNNNCCATYKPNNQRFSSQGAVSGGSRINRLKYQTQLRAQSTYEIMDPGSSACQVECKGAGGSKNSTGNVNAINGTYPVSLYRNTFPTYKRNLSGFCLRRGITSCNGRKQRCYIDKRGKLCRHAVPH